MVRLRIGVAGRGGVAARGAGLARGACVEVTRSVLFTAGISAVELEDDVRLG